MKATFFHLLSVCAHIAGSTRRSQFAITSFSGIEMI